MIQTDTFLARSQARGHSGGKMLSMSTEPHDRRLSTVRRPRAYDSEVRVPINSTDRADLQRMAQAGDRSLAAEIRRAIRRHLHDAATAREVRR